jgi:hypothetical protein
MFLIRITARWPFMHFQRAIFVLYLDVRYKFFWKELNIRKMTDSGGMILFLPKKPTHSNVALTWGNKRAYGIAVYALIIFNDRLKFFWNCAEVHVWWEFYSKETALPVPFTIGMPYISFNLSSYWRTKAKWRMSLSQNSNKVFFSDMCITLSSYDGIMPEKLLHDPNIHTVA